MKLDNLYILFIEKKKLLKKYTTFMNSENNKTSDPHRLLLNLSYKKTKKEVINMSLYQILALNIRGKI